ncbi:hypothetical protein [Staphylococcus capitis]|uniref:Lipoprotein n=1 Tax=Staphylococcus capitis TaxID=29388 RepID=A0ABX1SRR0_STACP|nr:hypothetical protein [Staphylococcus capitis]NMK53977.1 hypothetical protein [Staphylococcus capitis]NMK69330.1 hypothetical protein [Staphylococcus capitis]
MLKKLQIGAMIILSIIIVLGIMSYVGKGKEVEQLKKEKEEIKVPNKNALTKEFSQDEVKQYKKLVEQKFNDYQQHDLKEGEFNDDNKGVMTIKYLFSASSGKIFTEKDSVKDFVKYYSKFDYKISDVTARPYGKNGAEVYFKAKIKQNGKDVNSQYELARLQFNANDELVGGSLYAKE